ncbi:MAG: hypothetical protein MI865_13670, partial [Proteobacteria bacterium]|nr:hypothetical protein [Pseudomonadota bacterium]
LLTMCFPVHARMYQWTDPDTGTTQLSGKPPAWYRTGQVGPRIFVFEKGKIIDDTDVVLSDEHRELMRQRAYLQAEADLQQAKQAAIEAGQAREAEGLEDFPDEDFAMEDEMLAEPEEPLAMDVSEDADSARVKAEGLTLEDMKRLILDWEQAQEEKAKRIIGN